MISTTFDIDIATVETEMQEQVNEDHPVVKELVSAGYDLDKTIGAVEKCGTLPASLEYLDQQVIDENDEKELISSKPGYHQQTSIDDQFQMSW